MDKLFLIMWALILFVAWWKIFVKMGEPGWKSLIPFYNVYILFEKCWSRKAFIVAVSNSVVSFFLLYAMVNNEDNIILGIITTIAMIAELTILIKSAHKIANAFGYGFIMTIIMIVSLPIGALALAFGRNSYIGRNGEYRRGPVVRHTDDDDYIYNPMYNGDYYNNNDYSNNDNSYDYDSGNFGNDCDCCGDCDCGD